jgi:hypothetical protein
MEDYLKRAIECTAVAGANICIIHPDVYESAERNTEMHLKLLPFAKEHGVKIATENMYSWNREKNESAFGACGTSADFKKHLDLINDEKIKTNFADSALPTGDELLNQTTVEFDLTSFVPMLIGAMSNGGTVSFILKATDNNEEELLFMGDYPTVTMIIPKAQN